MKDEITARYLRNIRKGCFDRDYEEELADLRLKRIAKQKRLRKFELSLKELEENINKMDIDIALKNKFNRITKHLMILKTSYDMGE